jgi:hypothetical protein
MERRCLLRVLAAGTLSAVLPVRVDAQVLKPGNRVSLRCLGTGTGRARYLDGRTENGSVGLAPELTPKFSGTKWRVRAVRAGVVALECQGRVSGPRWLDGRTATGTVGLAPTTDKPFTGTRWQLVQLDEKNPDIVALKCLGDIEGPRWLDGRTGDGTVALARATDPPYTGTRWEVKLYPVITD